MNADPAHDLVDSESDPAGIRCDTFWCTAFHNERKDCGDRSGIYAGMVHPQDDVDRKRAELIEEIERQLQTKTSIEPVFTLRWTLGDGAGTTA